MILKNIVIVNDHCYANGGASKVALTSAIGLKKRGYNVILFSAVGPAMKELEGSGVKVVNLGKYDILNNPNRMGAFISGIWNKNAENEFRILLDELDNKNTIVHIHTWTKALSSSVVRTAINNNNKIVFTLHDYFTVCPNGGFYNYKTEEICDKRPMWPKCILCNCDSRKYSHKIWRVLRQLMQNNKGLIPSGIKNYIYISEISKNILKPYLTKDAFFYYVKNPVDIEKEEPVDVGNNDNFIYIGRLSKEKGCLLFARAAKELSLNAVFVGDGELKEEIKSIYPKAKITGWVEKETIKEELKKARALVFPSLWYETLGLTVLEAQAKGVPAIISNTCTASEIVKNNETGLWFKTGDVEDLKEKIKSIMNNDVAEAYGKNAYESYWENDFTIENHVNQIQKVYEDILKRG
ncbi:MAG: glycosyl transferase group 1 [Clostridiaceae bacterium]|jgi:glycosyltransferase involved in cell wall biosynthesis|nr:glycosyl transferase group 1 [Clostridiaceae bacterium]